MLADLDRPLTAPPALLAGLLALVTLLLTMGRLYAGLTIAVGQWRSAWCARWCSPRGCGWWRRGALIGLAAAVPLMRMLESQLYGIAPHDSTTTLAVGLIRLLAPGGLACDLPPRWAGHPRRNSASISLGVRYQDADDVAAADADAAVAVATWPWPPPRMPTTTTRTTTWP